LLKALDSLLEQETRKAITAQRADIQVERVRVEKIGEKPLPLYTLRVVFPPSKSIPAMALRPWEGVVLIRGQSVVGWGLFLGALSDLDGYIGIESDRYPPQEGQEYGLVKNDEIPLLKSQKSIATELTASDWVGRLLLEGTTSHMIPTMRKELNIQGLIGAQTQAFSYVTNLPREDFALIHGPPGTGKTQLIQKLLSWAIENKWRVLITSHTNVAVDNALERLVESSGPGILPYVSRIGSLLKTSDKVRQLLPQIRRGVPPDLSEISRELSSRLIVGMTLSKFGLVRRFLNLNAPFDLVIIDEASMASVMLTLVGILKTCARFVLVGDHKQLRPIVDLEVQDNELHRFLEKSLFELLIESFPSKSLLLDVQYRCNSDIMNFCSEQFYEGKIRTDPAVEAREALKIAEAPGSNWVKQTLEIDRGIIWIDTRHVSVSDWIKYGDNWSAYNLVEAEIVLDIWRRLSATIPSNQISVMSPFRAQTDILRRVAKQVAGNEEAEQFFVSLGQRDFLFATVDANQGREYLAVILNLTKSDPGSESIGRETALSDWRRLNVALTRAKERVYIVASGELATGRSLNRLLELYKWSRDDLDSHIEISSEDYEKGKNVNVEDLLKAALSSLKKQPLHRSPIGLTPEERRLLNQIHGRW
jgi:superfamily I DNA and/or RNA helicase